MSQNPRLTDASQLLTELDGGVLIQKLDAALSDVALGVTDTGKNGKVTLTFDVKQISASQVTVDHKLAFMRPTRRGKVSEESKTTTPLHVGARGRLTLFPETQTELFKGDATPEPKPAAQRERTGAEE